MQVQTVHNVFHLPLSNCMRLACMNACMHAQLNDHVCVGRLDLPTSRRTVSQVMMMNVYVLITFPRPCKALIHLGVCTCTTSFARTRARSNRLNLSSGCISYTPCTGSIKTNDGNRAHSSAAHACVTTLANLLNVIMATNVITFGSCMVYQQGYLAFLRPKQWGLKERGTNKQGFWRLVLLPVSSKKTAFRSKRWRGERALNSQQRKRG